MSYAGKKTTPEERIVCVLLAVILFSFTFCGTSQAEVQNKDTWDIISDAYIYAFPLVLMDATKTVSTNTQTAGNGRAPVNQFNHAAQLADADSRTVVTPNVDTVYTQAWLDIRSEPMVYVLPETNRFLNVQVLDAWTNTASVLDKAGVYAIALSEWEGELPEGVTRIDVPTATVWTIARIVLSGQDDMPNVRYIQSQMKLLPLSSYVSGEDYHAPEGKYTAENDYVPVEKVLSMDPQAFFGRANDLMAENTPAEADKDILREIAEIGVGPGLAFDAAILGDDGAEQWENVLRSLKKKLAMDSAGYAVNLGQWRYFGTPIGDFGTDYSYRTMVALSGLGANTVDVAIYPKTDVDDNGEKLSGRKTYTLHFDTLPPVADGGFWSVTAYGDDDFLIDNSIDRYCINDRSDYRLNDDGTLDIILSQTAPANTDNWLPAGEDGFHLYLRIYKPDMESLKDWQAPQIHADTSTLGFNTDVKPASSFTVAANSAVYDELDFDDRSEAEFAARGLIDAPEVLELTDASGKIIWSQAAYDFLDDYDKAPESANPSLWENTRNNHAYGLFEVTEGIYQVRGYDMSNLTVIKGNTGWILFDPLMSVECAEAAMQLIEKNLGSFPVKAVIISHSHVDHFGGILGVMRGEDKADENLSIDAQLASGKIPVIAPQGFTEHCIKENIYAGKAMGRRSNYQYGIMLTPGVTGKLGQGIGIGQSAGTVSFLTPSYEIKESGDVITIDGVELEFQLTPGTEAPAEMNTWIPSRNALWLAENCTSTLHNLYTLRGAEVRDGAAWAEYIIEAVTRYGKDVEVCFQSHNWPHWGNGTVNDYMVNTAAVYKYINDQTLTYINQGYTSDEISNMIHLSEALNKVWYTRQYYGTVAHNAKAVYQKYMGWYDGNPVHLNPLTPVDSAKKWVEYMGDTKEVLKKAKEDFDKGEYQWVAEVTNIIVFAEPDNMDARYLCADALEQLGYQAESGPWRNEYLTAAKELRFGNSSFTSGATGANSMMMEVDAPMLLNYIGIVMDKQSLADKDFCINFTLSDIGESHGVRMKNGVLLVYKNAPFDTADVSVTCPKQALFAILNSNKEAVSSMAKVEGSTELWQLFTDHINSFPTMGANPFNIIEP